MGLEIKKEGKFEYVERGEGHTLLLLHGLFGALSNWEPVLNHFSGRYKVLIPLMPVYQLPVLSSNVDNLAKFIHEFVEFKGLSNFTLLGNSLGGHVALVYTLKHKDLVHSMMLTGSSGLYENSMGGSFPRREDYNYIKERVGYTFYDPATASKELVDEVFEIINDRGKILRILSMAKSAIRHNLKKEIPSIDIPVCLIWGKDDKVTPPEVAEEFHSLLPNSELNWIDKCGHAPMMERPNEFNEVFDTFLSKTVPVA